eukprot:5855135-Karenia_brevis.AAC.1
MAMVYDDRVHNMLLGDFNFAMGVNDRISKHDAACKKNGADERNAKFWENTFGKFKLAEFAQEAFTCEHSYG